MLTNSISQHIRTHIFIFSLFYNYDIVYTAAECDLNLFLP